MNFILDFKLNLGKSFKDRYLWKQTSLGKIRFRFHNQEKITLLQKGYVKQKPTKQCVSRWKENSHRTAVRDKKKRSKSKFKWLRAAFFTWSIFCESDLRVGTHPVISITPLHILPNT